MGIADRAVGAGICWDPPRAGGSALAAAGSQAPFRGLRIKAAQEGFLQHISGKKV